MLIKLSVRLLYTPIHPEVNVRVSAHLSSKHWHFNVRTNLEWTDTEIGSVSQLWMTGAFVLPHRSSTISTDTSSQDNERKKYLWWAAQWGRGKGDANLRDDRVVAVHQIPSRINDWWMDVNCDEISDSLKVGHAWGFYFLPAMDLINPELSKTTQELRRNRIFLGVIINEWSGGRRTIINIIL